jgi:hypothetical protein
LEALRGAPAPILKISGFFALESWLRVYGTRSRKGGVTATLPFWGTVLEFACGKKHPIQH